MFYGDIQHTANGAKEKHIMDEQTVQAFSST